MMDHSAFLLSDLLGRNIGGMTVQELHALLNQINLKYDELEFQEPEDEDSDEYAEWEDTLECLDDLIDDIQDRLENLE